MTSDYMPTDELPEAEQGIIGEGETDDNGDPLECLDGRASDDACRGPVTYRYPLSASGRSFPRCDWHWEQRLHEHERLIQRYPDSSTPPDDFDPTYAGERWDEDY